MSDPAECPHEMGAPAWCVLCNGRARREAKEAALLAELNRPIAKAIARRAAIERARGAAMDAKRDRQWESGHEIEDRALIWGGNIDEFGKGHTKLRRPR